MTRCARCGRDNPDYIPYCGFCSAPLRGFSSAGGTSQAQYLPETASRPRGLINDQTRMPVLLIAIAIVMAVVGVLIYAAAWASVADEVGEFNNDPWNADFDGLGSAVALMFVAYVLWALGGIVLIAGLILLVMKSM